MSEKINLTLLSRQRQALLDFLAGGIDAVSANNPDLVAFVQKNEKNASSVIADIDEQLLKNNAAKFCSSGNTFDVTPPAAPNA